MAVAATAKRVTSRNASGPITASLRRRITRTPPKMNRRDRNDVAYLLSSRDWHDRSRRGEPVHFDNLGITFSPNSRIDASADDSDKSLKFTCKEAISKCPIAAR